MGRSGHAGELMRSDGACVDTTSIRSWVNHVPLMLGEGEVVGGSLGDALDTLVSAAQQCTASYANVLIQATFATRAKAEKVATPLIALIRQQYSLASRLGSRNDSVGSIMQTYPVDIRMRTVSARAARPRAISADAGRSVGRLAFLGLGSMGLGMASGECARGRLGTRTDTSRKVLQNSGFDVVGCDVYQPSLHKFAAMGGKTAASANEACQGADVLVLMVVSAVQAEETLFDKGAVQGGSLLTCTTCS